MHQKYKNDIDEIHAPDSLVEKTLLKIEQAQREESEKKENNWFAKLFNKQFNKQFAGALLAMSVIVGFVFLTNQSSNSSVEELDAMPIIRNGQTMDSRQITVAEYSKYLDVDIENLFEPAILTDAECLIQSNEDFISDDGIMEYDLDEMHIVLTLSYAHDVTPSALEDFDGTEIGDYLVKIAYHSGKDIYYAAGETEKYHYFISCTNTNEEQFIELVKNFLKK